MLIVPNRILGLHFLDQSVQSDDIRILRPQDDAGVSSESNLVDKISSRIFFESSFLSKSALGYRGLPLTIKVSDVQPPLFWISSINFFSDVQPPRCLPPSYFFSYLDVARRGQSTG